MKPGLPKIIATISLVCWGAVALPLSPCQAQPYQSADVEFSSNREGVSSSAKTSEMTWEAREQGRPDRRRGAGSR